jgi:hypothetical protein
VDDKFEFSNLKSFGVVEDGSQRNRCALLYHPIVGEVSGHYDVICFTQKSPPPPPPPPPPLPPTISFLSEGLVATIFRDKLQAVAPAKVSAKWSILGDLVGLRCFGLLLGADAAATLSLVGVSSKSLQSTASQVKGKVGRPTKNATPAIAVGCPFPPRANVLLALRHDIDEWHRSNRKLRRIVKSDSSRISYCCGGVDKMCTFDLKYISPKVGGVNVGHWDNSAFVPHSCTEVSIEKSISISRIASALEDNSSLLTMSAKEITDNVSKQISVDTKMISRKQAYRGQSKAIENLHGPTGEQFTTLIARLEELKSLDPTTQIRVTFAPEVVSVPSNSKKGMLENQFCLRFLSLDYILGSTIRLRGSPGVLERPTHRGDVSSVLHSDACHLTGSSRGILNLVVSPLTGSLSGASASAPGVAITLNEFSIAGSNENKVNWCSTFSHLAQHVELTGCLSLSDQMKGLGSAISEKTVIQDFLLCTKHLGDSVTDVCGKGVKTLLDRLIYCEDEAEAPALRDAFEEKCTASQKGYYKRKLQPREANFASFAMNRRENNYGSLVESLNSALKGAKGNGVRNLPMPLIPYAIIQRERDVLLRLKDSLEKEKVTTKGHNATLFATDKLEEINARLAGQNPRIMQNSGVEIYTVVFRNEGNVIVDINNRTCSNGCWERALIPCKHAVVVLRKLNRNPCDYVDSIYTINAAIAVIDIALRDWKQPPEQKSHLQYMQLAGNRTRIVGPHIHVIPGRKRKAR